MFNPCSVCLLILLTGIFTQHNPAPRREQSLWELAEVWPELSLKSGRRVSQFHGSDAQIESGARSERPQQPQRTNLLSAQHCCCWSRFPSFSKFNSSHSHSYCEHVHWAEKWSKLPAEQKST